MLWRSATSNHNAGHFNGYFARLAVATRAVARRKQQQPVPPHILALAVTPADETVGPIGHQVTVHARQVAHRLKVVKADQHYTAKKATFVLPSPTEPTPSD